MFGSVGTPKTSRVGSFFQHVNTHVEDVSNYLSERHVEDVSNYLSERHCSIQTHTHTHTVTHACSIAVFWEAPPVARSLEEGVIL
jgi:hypothetical protein